MADVLFLSVPCDSPRMNTPTHFLMTAAFRKALPRLRMVRGAVLWGSVAPDIPLYVLSIGGLIYFHQVTGRTLSDAAQHIFSTLYFEDPVWIGLHNCLHSPLSLFGLLTLNTLLLPRTSDWANWIRWFLFACLLHSIVDIFTHYDDGPLLLWPLNWRLRFPSPVSYWDHQHYGNEAARFELLLNLGLIAYLVGPPLYRRTLGKLAGRRNGEVSNNSSRVN